MTNPETGLLIWYPYLWARQQDVGETEGRKKRPCAMIVPAPDPRTGQTRLFLLAVSSLPPAHDQRAVEVPETERRRAGLAGWKGGWVYVSEYNYDVVETSFYYEPGEAPIGRFSPPFLRQVVSAFRAELTGRVAARIDRTEV
jgi:hypothetical protein